MFVGFVTNIRYASDIGNFNSVGVHECRISTNVTIKFFKDEDRFATLETQEDSTLNLIFWKTRVCCVMSCNWMRSVKRKVQTTPLDFPSRQTRQTTKRKAVLKSHIIHNTALYHCSNLQ